MGRLVAQTSLKARTRNAVFATMDKNRKMGIPTRLMSTISPLRTQTAEQPRRAGVCLNGRGKYELKNFDYRGKYEFWFSASKSSTRHDAE